jgi:glycerophosphoryl diester phosphodiesterase
MKPSTYATEAKSRGLNIITWTLERTGPGLEGYYWSTLEDIEVCSSTDTSSSLTKQTEACEIGLREGDKFNLLHVLAFQVEILGIFSDWPATVTFFANCYGLGINETAMMESEDPGTSGATTTVVKDVVLAVTVGVIARLFMA